MNNNQLENFGTVLVIVVIVALLGWALIGSSSSESTQSEDEYNEQYSCPSGKKYDFGYEACVDPGNEYDGAREACIEQVERDIERYGEWAENTYSC